jgi:hypothetical protein
MKTMVSFLLLLLAAGNLPGQTSVTTTPRIIHQNGRHALLVDGEPFFILGGQAHNSSAWPGMLPEVWQAAEKLHLNTLELPIYWEQIEPHPGQFDFSLVDTLLTQARAHKVRLVLLWFGTWKNASNHYMPEWMKRDPAKYPNVIGEKGDWIDSPSPFPEATLQADTKAFSSVMHHLAKADPRHTVIMVQVENEPGTWGSVRDYSPAAQKLFEGTVPARLLEPAVLNQLPHEASSGSWREVFGKNADEYFHAWSVASYIGKVAAAGRQENALPLYINVALRDPLSNPGPGNYESGGATDNVLAIYKAAAPAIDILAPDIYLSGNEKVLKVLELYGRSDNPLFVPETIPGAVYAKYIYAVLAHGGIGFSPFGIDDNGRDSPDSVITARLTPVGEEYRTLAPMMRELAKWAFEGKITAVVEDENHGPQTIDLGNWQATVNFGGFGRGEDLPPNAQPVGKMMIIRLSEDKFIAIGTHSRITFKPTGKSSGRPWQYLKVEEGHFENGIFKPLRILNGDETDWGGPYFGNKPRVLEISLVLR